MATTMKPVVTEEKTLAATMKPGGSGVSSSTVMVSNAASASTSAPAVPSSSSWPAPLPSSSPEAPVNPAPQPQDYDYMEYEDPKSFDPSRSKLSTGALLKLEEPVCFMYRYYANNTIFTNRGCTTLLNANKFLTCQSLSNGYPMVGCRICETDGCNKYDLDEVNDDHLNGAGKVKAVTAILVAVASLIFQNIY
uniref:Activin types 1 and 2 receptor protein n=1 Tax=Musca domestica TaxID=7370 RepID=T1PME2_MUSDO